MKDAEWIATLMQHGLLQTQLHPQPGAARNCAIWALSAEPGAGAESLHQPLQKVLETTNIKLASVVSDMQGVFRTSQSYANCWLGRRM